MLADIVVMWTSSKRLGKDFIPDRTLETEIGLFYIEHERGTHTPATIRQKLKNYIRYFRETGEQFYLLFTVLDEEAVEDMVKLFDDMNCPSHYFAAVFSDVVNDPLDALLTSRFTTKNFSNMLSIT